MEQRDNVVEINRRQKHVMAVLLEMFWCKDKDDIKDDVKLPPELSKVVVKWEKKAKELNSRSPQVGKEEENSLQGNLRVGKAPTIKNAKNSKMQVEESINSMEENIK